jgi:hypothetical protein
MPIAELTLLANWLQTIFVGLTFFGLFWQLRKVSAIS